MFEMTPHTILRRMTAQAIRMLFANAAEIKPLSDGYTSYIQAKGMYSTSIVVDTGASKAVLTCAVSSKGATSIPPTLSWGLSVYVQTHTKQVLIATTNAVGPVQASIGLALSNLVNKKRFRNRLNALRPFHEIVALDYMEEIFAAVETPSNLAYVLGARQKRHYISASKALPSTEYTSYGNCYRLSLPEILSNMRREFEFKPAGTRWRMPLPLLRSALYSSESWNSRHDGGLSRAVPGAGEVPCLGSITASDIDTLLDFIKASLKYNAASGRPAAGFDNVQKALHERARQTPAHWYLCGPTQPLYVKDGHLSQFFVRGVSIYIDSNLEKGEIQAATVATGVLKSTDVRTFNIYCLTLK